MEKLSRRGKRGGGDGNSIGEKYRDGTQRPTAQQKERLRSNMIAEKERKAAIAKRSKADKASARLKALEEKEATKLEALEKKLAAQKQKLVEAHNLVMDMVPSLKCFLPQSLMTPWHQRRRITPTMRNMQ